MADQEKDKSKGPLLRVREALAGRKYRSVDDVRTTLEAYGLKFLSDQRLETRIGLLIDYQNEMEKNVIATEDLPTYIENLTKRLDLINRVIIEEAVPYSEARDKEEVFRRFQAWKGMFGMAKSWILVAREAVNRENTETEEVEEILGDILKGGFIDNREFVSNLHMSLEKWFYADGEIFITYCFGSKDVSERLGLVVQSMMPMMMGGGETLTGSGGRTSEDQMRHPRGGPYPRRIGNNIED